MTLVGDEDVGGLEVEVEDAAGVEVRDAGGEFGEDLPYASFVELLVCVAVLVEPVLEVSVRAELGEDEEVTGLLPGVDERDEMRRAVLGGGEEAEDVDLLEAAETAREKESSALPPSRKRRKGRQTGPWVR